MNGVLLTHRPVVRIGKSRSYHRKQPRHSWSGEIRYDCLICFWP